MVCQRKWYVVTVGKEPGVYSTWLEAAPKTKHIPGGAIHQSFPTEEKAIRAFKAALARGEVKAYPNAGKEDGFTNDSKNASLSPLGTEASLLRTPLDLKEEVKPTGSQAPPFSSPTRVAKLGRILRQSPTIDSCSTSSSPPTGVTQYAPLYAEDDIPPGCPTTRPSPHSTFTSSTSTAYFDIGHEHDMDTEEVLMQLEVSDWDSHPGAEEHTSKSSRCMPLHPDTPSRRIGVPYRSLTDLAEMKSVDSRIWLPKSRVFDPDEIKPRPLTRPPSPVKRGISPALGPKTVGSSPQLRHQASLVNSPFVRVDRGRRSRLAPSPSLPILPGWEPGDNFSSCESRPIQSLENHRVDVGERRVLGKDEYLAERPAEYCPGPRNGRRTHAQLVPRDGRDERSVIMVYCPPNCLHETCLDPSQPTCPQYVDASVSPIITITSRVQRTDNPTKSRPKERDLEEDNPYELAGFAHVPHQGIAPETDVRSPIAKGTMVPMNAAETLLGRPSPLIGVTDFRINRWNV